MALARRKLLNDDTIKWHTFGLGHAPYFTQTQLPLRTLTKTVNLRGDKS
jgi:hypothetical protein